MMIVIITIIIKLIEREIKANKKQKTLKPN